MNDFFYFGNHFKLVTTELFMLLLCQLYFYFSHLCLIVAAVFITNLCVCCFTSYLDCVFTHGL